jgi:hypothetical protein
MILIDTSVWINFLRRGDPKMVGLLDSNTVLSHPFIVGELACGNISNREELLTDLRRLPQAVMASDEEVLELIEIHSLMGRGIGYLDAHLLASALLSDHASLWTHDRKLAAVAAQLSLSH